MTDRPTGAVTLRKPTAEDFRVSLKLGLQDFLSEPLIAAFFASFFMLFLGLSPMTNVSTTLDVFLTNQGLMMIGFGSVIGAFFALLVFFHDGVRNAVTH